jgi:hypothetical protein
MSDEKCEVCGCIGDFEGCRECNGTGQRPAAERVSEAPTLDECIRFCEVAHEAGYNDNMLRYFTEIGRLLQRRRDEQRGEWVEWKPGDALPPVGEYWTTTVSGCVTMLVYESRPESDHNAADDWKWCGVIAYWSIRLPAPYTPRQP